MDVVIFETASPSRRFRPGLEHSNNECQHNVWVVEFETVTAIKFTSVFFRSPTSNNCRWRTECCRFHCSGVGISFSSYFACSFSICFAFCRLWFCLERTVVFVHLMICKSGVLALLWYWRHVVAVWSHFLTWVLWLWRKYVLRFWHFRWARYKIISCITLHAWHAASHYEQWNIVNEDERMVQKNQQKISTEWCSGKISEQEIVNVALPSLYAIVYILVEWIECSKNTNFSPMYTGLQVSIRAQLVA